MKTSYIKLGEAEYPVCFSADAIEAIEEAFGGYQKWLEQLQSGSVKVYNKTIQIFVDAGLEYCKTAGRDCPPPLKGRPSAIVGLDDLPGIMDTILKCVHDDSERTVEVRSKNE